MGIPVRDGRLSLGRLRGLLPRDETLEVVAGFALACWVGVGRGLRVPRTRREGRPVRMGVWSWRAGSPLGAATPGLRRVAVVVGFRRRCGTR